MEQLIRVIGVGSVVDLAGKRFFNRFSVIYTLIIVSGDLMTIWFCLEEQGISLFVFHHHHHHNCVGMRSIDRLSIIDTFNIVCCRPTVHQIK